MRSRWVHSLLALLLLLQSVTTLAAVPVAIPDSRIPLELSADKSGDSYRTSALPCHGDSASSVALQTSKNCCESMEEAGCVLCCSMLTSAVSCGVIMGSTNMRIHYPPDAGYISMQNPLYGLFRPPRSS